MASTGENKSPSSDQSDERQCRICLDGTDDTLGRLIRPCLCKGSISYVHVKCLQRWRNSSPTASAFFTCPQCHYQYRFARTQIVGLATNPVVIAALSTVFFVLLVLASSTITTTFISAFDDTYDSEPSYSYWSLSSYWYNPIDVGHDLVRVGLRIIQDESGGLFDADTLFSTRAQAEGSLEPPSPPGIMKRLLRRFVLGLPVVGAGSLVHMLLSLPLLTPVHWLARFRGGRSRRNSGSRDTAAVVIIILLIGALQGLSTDGELVQADPAPCRGHHPRGRPGLIPPPSACASSAPIVVSSSASASALASRRWSGAVLTYLFRAMFRGFVLVLTIF
ncbi:hypothetical protein HETIRDRAFT_469399 [Heterobasidion irregulare TC 32-1]|uniref:Uncharacterized protein n=1 Tax=Heterobasidion irregulare (strain TC 32-1) TaxID=747525 RepID=W4KQT3_HETIT|nr:uncharacterized protein HETIRDRAFT_469399 [Heterobasidion irregulare TC 32-1]ETW87406.1 hypothetical protein HETIRDRAFT_469399 [Heterobasidion irregulare TC 32-1]